LSALEPIEGLLQDLLSRMGLAEPDLFSAMADEWDQLAGEPWSGRSRPLLLRNGELLVEVEALALVGVFRYAVGDLQRRLDGRFGMGTIESVRVQGPAPGRSR
jgi:hypothetical protein